MAPSLRHRQSESLSPRQLFQSQVGSLNNDDSGKGHRRNKSISLKYNPYELQHVSNLGVHNKNNSTIRFSSRSPITHRISDLRKVQEEPDFILEERQAWSRKSPNTKYQSVPRLQPEPFLIYDEGETSEDEGKSGQSLQPFGPTDTLMDITDRPKTSRGHGIASVSALDSPLTKSKFMEGSMSNRSQGVASSWDIHAGKYDVTTSDTEDDATPKASVKSQSSSVDLRDFDPPSASSNTVRRTLFRRKSSGKTLDESVTRKEKKKAAKEDEEKKSKKRLRKSLSSWSLHNLGEKMGIFNKSSSSINDAEADSATGRSGDIYDQTTVLDERKRKAEIAYAQQFGSKKQKDNSGGVASSAAAVAVPESDSDKFATIRHKPSTQDPNATIRARSGARAQRTSLQPSDLTAVFHTEHHVDHDARKRPTRRELEKENQQLREMLRRSQSSRASHDSLRAQYRQPLTHISTNSMDCGQPFANDGGKPVPPPRLSSHRKSTGGSGNTHTQRAMSVDFPSHKVLSPIQNAPDLTTHQRKRHSLDLAPRPSLPELPRSVGMIVEDPEGEESDGDKTKPILGRTRSHTLRMTRRRHSMHSGDPQKSVSSHGKENAKVNLSSNIPTIIVSTTMDGSNELRNDWQGWDDDVF